MREKSDNENCFLTIKVGVCPTHRAAFQYSDRSDRIQPGSRVFQYGKTWMKNLAVPIGDLKPLRRLFEQVEAWEEKKS